MATQNQVTVGINYDTCTQWRMKNDRAGKHLVIWKKVLDILREKKAGSKQHLQYSLFLKFKTNLYLEKKIGDIYTKKWLSLGGGITSNYDFLTCALKKFLQISYDVHAIRKN